jgi:hypothetical protein
MRRNASLTDPCRGRHRTSAPVRGIGRLVATRRLVMSTPRFTRWPGGW